MFTDTRERVCSDCPRNTLRVTSSDVVDTAVTIGYTTVTVAAIAVFVGALVRRWRGATPALRRALTPVFATGGALLGLTAFELTLEAATGAGYDSLRWVFFVVLILIPLAFLFGLLRSQLAHRSVSRYVIDLPASATAQERVEALRTALRDPTLEVVYWVPESQSYVDTAGRPATLPGNGGRATTPIEGDAGPIALLVHDDALLHEPELLGSVAAAARLGLERERLAAELRARLDELQRERDFVAAVVNSAPTFFCVVDEDGGTTRFNDTLAEVSGVVDDKRARGKPFWELFVTPDAQEAARAGFADVPALDAELPLETPSGDRRSIVWSTTPIRDAQGHERYLLCGLDVTVVRRQTELLSAVGDATPGLLCVVERDGRISEDGVNLSLRQLTGFTHHEFEERPFWDVFPPPEEAEDVRRAIEAAVAGEDIGEQESHWVTTSGERRVVAWTFHRLPRVRNVEFLISGTDITERKRQELEIRRERDFGHAVTDATPSLLIVLDPQRRVIAEGGANVAAETVLGYTEADLGGRDFVETFIPEADHEQVRAWIADDGRRGRHEHESEWVTRDGKRLVVAWSCTPLREGGLGLLVCGTDVTERKRHEVELRASRQRIVAAADEERRRLERNLHDGAQQRLVSLSLALRLAQSKLGSDPAAAEPLLTNASEELALALEELRELARGIHPAVLTDRGLAPALEVLAARSPVPVELEAPTERLPDPVEAAAYYVVSEALANVAKYAGASHARVSVTRQDGRAVVEVTDDGVGGADAARGTGLRGLSDRVEALDGRLQVQSDAGTGTCVRAEIPV
jgi:PAS domain S-box-containing protein